MQLTAKCGPRTGSLSLHEASTIGDLHAAVRVAFELPADTQLRILGKGKALAADEHLSLQAAGLSTGVKLMVMQTRAAERAAVEEAQPERMRGFEDDDRRLRTGGVSTGVPSSAAHRSRTSSSSYRFGDISTLPVPPGAKPGREAAESLLHKLSTDPSILAIMASHRWSVGRLSEMPPEGQVGVSASCLMGLNKNAGQEILLRLRTDDWQGLRAYNSLIDVLLHELTHNVFGDHDNDFKELNSVLKREYREHAAASAGRALAGDAGAVARPRLEEPDHSASSEGHVLGGPTLTSDVMSADDRMSAREAAARAAAARARSSGDGPMPAMDPRCACGLCIATPCEECQAEECQTEA